MPNKFIPSTANTKQSRNSNAPMLISPGSEITKVLNNMRRPFSFRTRRNTLARRNTRSTDVVDPTFAATPKMLVTTQKKSNKFHLDPKYFRPIAVSLIAASRMKVTVHAKEIPLSQFVQSSVCS